MTAHADLARTSPARGLLRGLSLAVAGLVSLALMLDPYLLAGVSSSRVHGALPPMMLGVAGLFVYGLGFEPNGRLLRMILHPAVSWLLFLAGAVAIAGAMWHLLAT